MPLQADSEKPVAHQRKLTCVKSSWG